MSQQQSGAAVGAPLTDTVSEDSIADYLKSHPDFFERHPALVLGLKLPHRAGGAAISLVERQVSMLRQRNAQLERQLKDLVAVAKQNDALVEKIHQLCLKLMRAPTLPARLERARDRACARISPPSVRCSCCFPMRRPRPCAKVSFAA